MFKTAASSVIAVSRVAALHKLVLGQGFRGLQSSEFMRRCLVQESLFLVRNVHKKDSQRRYLDANRRMEVPKTDLKQIEAVLY